jgi:hypothetical protein
MHLRSISRMSLPFVVAAILGATGCGSKLDRNDGVVGQFNQELTSPPAFDHVVIVIDENRSYSTVVGSSAAPYINNTLIAGGALFTNSVAITHPSQPNYLALFSGSTQAVVDDTCPPPGSPYTTANLAHALIAAGRSFIGYSENLPSVGDVSCGSSGYVRKHNPWVDWQGSGTNQLPTSVNQPFTAFPTSNFAALPTVSVVVPNLTDDMHDGTVPQGDTWLQSHLDAYAQWALTHNSLLILTFDESDGGSPTNQIPTIFYGAKVVHGNYSESIDHYTALRTIEDMYGLAPIGAAASRTAIADCWTGGTGGSFSLAVNSADLDHGNASFSGMCVFVDNTSACAGFTPYSATLPSGSHTVTMTNFGSNVFDHWDNGSTNLARVVNLTANTTLTAYYHTASSFTVTVNALDLDHANAPINGMCVFVDDTSTCAGFTPYTATLPSGSHSITMTNFGSKIFNHWDNGSTSAARTVNLTANSTFNAYYHTL